jgi:hypothetical protein
VRRLHGVAAVLVAVACVAVVVGYQASRPAAATPNPVVFIPSPAFYDSFSPSVRATIADVYWLYTIQYYGEHIKTDGRLDSLSRMVDLVTRLSPHFKEAYFFGAFAMIDAGRPGVGYALLERGFKANPDDWHFPFYLGFFAYTYAANATKDQIASQWYATAAKLPGAPSYVSRLAAEMATKGNDRQKAVELWALVYAQGDKYARQKAAAALDKLLPADKIAREKAVASLKDLIPPDEFDQFVADVFRKYL